MLFSSPKKQPVKKRTAHGKLKKEWQVLFLAKPQITQILQFTSDQVIPAVRSHEKLSEILIELQARENKALDIKPLLNRVVENEPANEWRKNKKHLPPKRTVRLSQQAAGSKGKVPRFDEAHPSEYGSTTIRRPGRAEAVLPGREQCPSCGMVVTGNNMKCRCG